MSIWCSWPRIGYDAAVSERGEVRSYATGWSNHYPTTSGEVEQPAAVAIAQIPIWCVPGHTDDEDVDVDGRGPWLRLDMDGAEHDFMSGGKPTGKPAHLSVIMDEAAARALAADLLAWADTPEVLPDTRKATS